MRWGGNVGDEGGLGEMWGVEIRDAEINKNDL